MSMSTGTITQMKPLKLRNLTARQWMWAIRYPLGTRRHFKQVNAPHPEGVMTPQVARELTKELIEPWGWRALSAFAIFGALLAVSWAIVIGVVWLVWSVLT